MNTNITISETRQIKRSQIHLNPCNPKNHTEQEIKKQIKNFKSVGFLGGIVWNEASGNLIDGHRRVFALDLIHGYNGANDYDLKVEVCNLDAKTEKEQLVFMSVANGNVDYSAIAEFVNEIDYKNAGINELDYQTILSFADLKTDIEIPDVADLLDAPQPKSYEERKSEIMKKKQNQRTETEDNGQKTLILTFDNERNKAYFLEMLGLAECENYGCLKGELLLERLS